MSIFFIIKNDMYFDFFCFLSFFSALEVYLPCFSKDKPKDQQPYKSVDTDLGNTKMAWLSM